MSTVEPDPVPEPEETQPEPIGIAVIRVRDPETGEERLEISDFGGHDPLATPAVLRLAAAIREKQLGL